MNFESIDEVKEYVCEYTDKKNCENENVPQGIDELILEVIELRSIIYAFQETETNINIFKDKVFYSQWLNGAVYTIFCTLGKLVSKDNRDRSLRQLWDQTAQLLSEENYFTREELNYINRQLNISSGKFTNGNSKAILFRNKVIAHNEQYPKIEWADVDSDFRVLIRMWSLLVSSSTMSFLSFRTFDQAFDGINNFFQQSELSKLKEKHKEYQNKVIEWSSSYAHNNFPDKGRHIFSKPKMSTTIKIYDIDT